MYTKKWTEKDRIKTTNKRKEKSNGELPKYDEDFKQSLVNLYHSGKTQTELCKENMEYPILP